MTKEQIEQRIKDKQTEIANLEEEHKKFVEQFNRQIALSRDEYNKLVGAIDVLKEQLSDKIPRKSDAVDQ